ncbi:MAG: PilZ domain-containing protein [Candidatus Omnitrophica bacterium]|jgi:c-di-GMP-binding flagellar brake protein YcgR|nr:PilZ domain-containing protein [Candidatus Omnitrophota bacterium]
MVERRKYPRVDISLPVECQNLPAHNYFYTVSKDLSLIGTKIISNSFLSKGDVMTVNLNFIKRVLNLKAKVAWCNRERAADRYAVGLEFIEVSNEVRDNLSSFLNKIYNS